MNKNLSPARRASRGSLLIVAMVFSTVIAVVLVTYLRMASTALKLSERAFCEDSAMNLTEAGLEQAMVAINSSTWSSPWSTSGSNATGNFTGFSIGQNMGGSVKVYVQNYASSSPTVTAEGIVQPASGPAIIKMVQISGLIQRSLFAKGLVGRNGVSFSGNNPSVDAWDSNPTAAATGNYTPVSYASSVKDAKGSIAAINVTATDAVGNADIWGTASVGGNSTSSISVGPQGRVGPFGTAAGVKDANSVSANFTDNLPAVTVPTRNYTNTLTNPPATLPQVDNHGNITDTAASDGKYYYNVSGTLSSSLAITAGKNVILLFSTPSGSKSINMAGSDEIKINTGANLAIYTAGDIKFAGQADVNNQNGSGTTTSFQIWSTNTTDPSANGGTPTQDITIAGNGTLVGTIYAPNASLSAKGGGNVGDIYGSFVAYSVSMTGGDAFHYDENLARTGNGGTYSPTNWREIVSLTDRATYSSNFNF